MGVSPAPLPKGVKWAPETRASDVHGLIVPSSSMIAARWGKIFVDLSSGEKRDTTFTGGSGQVRKGAAVPGYQRSSVSGLSRDGAKAISP